MNLQVSFSAGFWASQFKFLFVKTSYSRKKKKKTLEFNFPRKGVHTVKLSFLSLWSYILFLFSERIFYAWWFSRYMQHMHPALEIQGAISISVLVCVFTGRFNSEHYVRKTLQGCSRLVWTQCSLTRFLVDIMQWNPAHKWGYNFE